MARRVLVEQRALGRLEQVEQGAAVAAGAVTDGRRATWATASGDSAVVRNVCRPRIRSRCSCHVTPRSPRHTSPLCAMPECDHTQLCWLGSTAHGDVVGEPDALAAGDADHPVERHARSLHHAHRLVAADQRAPCGP